MTQAQLIERLTYFTNAENPIGAALYFILKENDQTIIRFADIEDGAKNELKDRFIEYIQEKFIDNEELSYKSLSDADDRKNVVYRYDVDERPASLTILNQILAEEEQPKFNFNNDSLQNLQGYLITIGNEANKIVLYKKHHPINLLKRDRFLLIPSNERLVQIDRDAIALDRNFDFMLVDDNLIVLKLSILEKHFGYDEVIRNQANEAINFIQQNELLEDIAVLKELAENLTHARKLMKIKKSPVLGVPILDVIAFIKTHPQLTGRIRFNDDESKISLDTAISKKLFLKLLNDDYLFSELTKLQYQSLAKDPLETEN